MERTEIERIRAFNRFIAVELAVFDRFAYGTRYSLTEMRIIGEIGRGNGCTANDLVRNLGMDKGYLSRTLSHLERNGLITRTTSAEDGRFKQLALTTLGRETFDEFETIGNAALERRLEGLSSQQIERIIESMETIQNELEERS